MIHAGSHRPTERHAIDVNQRLPGAMPDYCGACAFQAPDAAASGAVIEPSPPAAPAFTTEDALIKIKPANIFFINLTPNINLLFSF
ncbi:MAG: hypothetical protein RQ806_00190 [Erythrobacter sp.]|nr:hypothetical protein [Erythrobacter sp.]